MVETQKKRRSFSQSGSPNQPADPRKDLTKEQLAGIGAIALAFNELEFGLEKIIIWGMSLAAPFAMEVAKRIASVEKKIELAKTVVGEGQIGLNKLLHPHAVNIQDDALWILGRIRELKHHRDNAIHCRILQPDKGVGERMHYDASVSPADLREASLNQICDRVVLISDALGCIASTVNLVHYLPISPIAKLGLNTPRGAHVVEQHFTLVRNVRNILGGLPQLPDAPQLD